VGKLVILTLRHGRTNKSSYISPEGLLGHCTDENLDRRSACGAIAIEWLIGTEAFALSVECDKIYIVMREVFA
jgi:hypothetical protein